MEEILSFREYLSQLNISKEEKDFTFSFCKKQDYLNQLLQILASKIHQPINSGYGNLNADICFIFLNKKIFLSFKEQLQPYLEYYGLNYWNIYITFIQKTDSFYSYNLKYLIQEINCINSKIIYLIGIKKEYFFSLKREFISLFPTKQYHFVFVPIKQLINASKEELLITFSSLKNQ